MATIETTVNIHFNFDLNGQSINHFVKSPAVVETDGTLKGITVHLDIDARDFAKMLAPYVAREMPSVVRNSTGAKNTTGGC